MPRAPILVARLALLSLIWGATAPGRPVVAQHLNEGPPGQLGATLDDHIAWLAFHDAGWRAMNKGWYDTAQREFTSAIRVAQRRTLNEPRILARSYSSLAWSLQKQGRTVEAEPLANWALETRRSRFGPNTEPLARSLNQVAIIDLELNRFAAAEPLLREVIAMRSSGNDSIDLERAQSESLLGLGLAAQRRYAEAELEFARSVALRQEEQGAKAPELGDELNNLAWTQIEQGKRPEARATMDRALKILAKARGESDPSVARALDGLARLDVEQKDLGAAEAKYRRVIAIYEQPGAGQPGPLRDARRHLADLLDKMGRAEEAGKVRILAGTTSATITPTTANRARGLEAGVPLVAPNGPANPQLDAPSRGRP